VNTNDENILSGNKKIKINIPLTEIDEKSAVSLPLVRG